MILCIFIYMILCIYDIIYIIILNILCILYIYSVNILNYTLYYFTLIFKNFYNLAYYNINIYIYINDIHIILVTNKIFILKRINKTQYIKTV